MKPDELTALLRAWRKDIDSVPFPDFTHLIQEGQKQ